MYVFSHFVTIYSILQAKEKAEEFQDSEKHMKLKKKTILKRQAL